MNTKEIIKQNNLKRKELTPENLKVYEEVVMYLRGDLSISEHVTEVTLLDLLDHLLESQMHEVTTEEFFGDNPEQFAIDLVAEIPKESKSNIYLFILSLVCLFFGLFRITTSLIDAIYFYVFNKVNKVNVIQELISNSIIVLVIVTILLIAIKKFQNNSFSNNSNIQKNILFTIILSSLFVPFIVIKFIPHLLPNGGMITIPWYINFLIGIILIVIYKLLFNISKNNKELVFFR
ncbi:hypothetical protein ACMGE9_03225 [Macrococcus sp. EM39E]|uniref:hypothetical protein n=1 Tax=Macrococcus animalis TaxID=3395467 RepID=UPI0039BFE366